jgi:multidrug efflux pump subunit AcrA (membrane-fusion protein)
MKHPTKQRAVLLIVTFVALLLSACQATSEPGPTPGATLVAVGAQGPVGGTLRALGTIRPVQVLPLSFRTSGPIEAIHVRAGMRVAAGDALARLGTADLELDLAQAVAEVAYLQAALDKLLDGASPAVATRAEEEHKAEVAQTELALASARLQVERAEHTSTASSVTAAQSSLAQLELRIAEARAAAPLPNVALAEVDLARAEHALAAVQDEYKKALDRPWEPQEIRDGLARAVQRAEWDLQSARARLTTAHNAARAHALSVEALSAQVTTAESQLTQALEAQAAYSVTLALLETEVAVAERRLADLERWTNPSLDPPSPRELTQAEVRLRQAELVVERLESAIEGAVLRAPWDGVVASIESEVGAWAAPGVPVASLIDTSRWYVETRNVSELSIGRVSVGQPATVQVTALGETIRGRVEIISPVAVVQQGDTTYTLMVALDVTDWPLRAGMNAQVEIELN